MKHVQVEGNKRRCDSSQACQKQKNNRLRFVAEVCPLQSSFL